MNKCTVVEYTSKAYSALGDRPKTGDVRAMSKRLFKSLDDKSKDAVFECAEALLQKGGYPYWVVAFEFALKMKSDYTHDDFERFEAWVFKYVRNWYDCDDFCTHAFGELLIKYPSLMPRVKDWVSHKQFAVRRSAPVVLILGAKRGVVPPSLIFDVCDKLMHDSHYLVLKGYGWLLKVYSQTNSKAVIDYVNRHKESMPRVSLRYAIEKMPKDTRKELMNREL